MQVFQTSSFKKVVKKLNNKQKNYLDEAVRAILSEPKVGIPKLGDLNSVRVYKLVDQLTLLAYTYNNQEKSITLLAMGTHENFYRDLKKQIN